jgi:hypothetical protein
MNENEKQFVKKIADELIEGAKKLKEYAETEDITGIWLTNINLSKLVNQLDGFIEEKRKDN